MKNMFYFLTLLFLMGSCTPESDLGNFDQKENQLQAMKTKKACSLDIDCTYAFQITEEGCLFDLWDVLEQIKQKSCPGATLSWKTGTQPWVNLGQGEEYLTILYVENCEGLSCQQYTVNFSCQDTCTTVGCNYNIDIIEGEDACEYAITFNCDTELEVDGSSQQSIPLGNGVCAVILILEDGESRDLTFTTEDGQECTETIRCGEDPCNCDVLDIDVTVDPSGNNCCLITVTTIIPPSFNCDYTASFHNLHPVDGPPIDYDVVDSGAHWTQFEVCYQVNHPYDLYATVQMVNNHTLICNQVEIPFSPVGCF